MISDNDEGGSWVASKDLKIGDKFLDENEVVSTLVFSEHKEFSDGIAVYNFEAQGNHNYFVIAETGAFGQTCILYTMALANKLMHLGASL